MDKKLELEEDWMGQYCPATRQPKRGQLCKPMYFLGIHPYKFAFCFVISYLTPPFKMQRRCLVSHIVVIALHNNIHLVYIAGQLRCNPPSPQKPLATRQEKKKNHYLYLNGDLIIFLLSLFFFSTKAPIPYHQDPSRKEKMFFLLFFPQDVLIIYRCREGMIKRSLFSLAVPAKFYIITGLLLDRYC